jgi:hypothetical protein
VASSPSSKTQANGWASAMWKKPPGAHEVGHHLGPAGNVGQPVEHPEGGEDHVEVALQPVREVDHVGDDEAGRQAGLGGQEPRLRDGPLREVGPGDPGGPPGPRERVQPEVALQVEQVLAGEEGGVGGPVRWGQESGVRIRGARRSPAEGQIPRSPRPTGRPPLKGTAPPRL